MSYANTILDRINTIGKLDNQFKNTFENPEEVKVEPFNEVTETKEGIQFTIPACSVLHLAVSL